MATRAGIGQDKWNALLARLESVGAGADTLTERFVRASGAGGQHINKTSSAVYLLHAPSGLEVKAQTSRSQANNRYQARVRLVEKLEALRDGERSKEQARIEKIRRQKRKRSRRAKAKTMDDKSRHAEKKQQRKTPSHHD